MLDKNEPTYEARKQYFMEKMEEKLDAVNLFKKSKNKRKRKLQHIDNKIEDCLNPRKTKMIFEFNNRESASIKLYAVKKRANIKVISRFMAGKLLMFTKLSLKSFVCEIIETYCFPNEKTKQIFKKYQIEKVEIYHILTDTDSTSLKSIFISGLESDIPESKYREIILEFVTDIYKRFDSSHPFWEIFDARKENQ